MPKIISHYVAGIDRDFRLDLAAAQRIEDSIGSLLAFTRRAGNGDVKFRELVTILFFSRVNPDRVSFDAFSESIFKEGYPKYLTLVGQLIEDFFQFGAEAQESESKENTIPSR